VEHFRDAQSNTFPLFALAALFLQKRMRRDFNLNKEASENGQRGDTDGAAYSFLRWSSCEKLYSISRVFHVEHSCDVVSNISHYKGPEGHKGEGREVVGAHMFHVEHE